MQGSHMWIQEMRVPRQTRKNDAAWPTAYQSGLSRSESGTVCSCIPCCVPWPLRSWCGVSGADLTLVTYPHVALEPCVGAL